MNEEAGLESCQLTNAVLGIASWSRSSDEQAQKFQANASGKAEVFFF